MKEVKAKDLRKNDSVLDVDDISCSVVEIYEFDKDEMFLVLRGNNDGVKRIGTISKNAKVKKLE